jgi:hypothetical protein
MAARMTRRRPDGRYQVKASVRWRQGDGLCWYGLEATALAAGETAG